MKKLLCALLGMLLAGTSWSVTLPAGYTELEYIESTGTQYIDTGFYYTSANHKAVVKFSHVEPGSGAYPYWVWGADGGGGGGAGSRTGALALQSGGTKIGVGVGSAAVGTTTYTIDNPSTPITVSVETKSNNTFTVIKDGVAVYTDVSFAGSGVAETPVTEVLFGVHAVNGVNRMVATKIYFAQFYANGTLVRDFVPAKNSSGVVGMYDTVSGTFFTNAGTGEFVAGPVVPEQQIRIATTAYNSARFSPVVTELNTTIATIRDVVTNTINQTKAIADLQATKQTRPNENCPAGKKCLLVEDNDGQPHWYEIIENAD